MEVFDKIYANYDKYVSIVSRVVGNNNPFIEDIVSRCIEKFYHMIQEGKVKYSNNPNQESNEVNLYYFEAMLNNAALDYVKTKKNRLTIRLNQPIEVEDVEPNKFSTFDINKISEFLDEYQKINVHNKFRADIFRYYYFEGINISKLHREVNINRPLLTESRDIVLNTLKLWLKEHEEKRVMSRL